MKYLMHRWLNKSWVKIKDVVRAINTLFGCIFWTAFANQAVATLPYNPQSNLHRQTAKCFSKKDGSNPSVYHLTDKPESFLVMSSASILSFNLLRTMVIHSPFL